MGTATFWSLLWQICCLQIHRKIKRHFPGIGDRLKIPHSEEYRHSARVWLRQVHEEILLCHLVQSKVMCQQVINKVYQVRTLHLLHNLQSLKLSSQMRLLSNLVALFFFPFLVLKRKILSSGLTKGGKKLHDFLKLLLHA